MPSVGSVTASSFTGRRPQTLETETEIDNIVEYLLLRDTPIQVIPICISGGRPVQGIVFIMQITESIERSRQVVQST